MIALTSGNCKAVSLLIRCEKTKLDTTNESDETALDIAKRDASVCKDMVKGIESRDDMISEYGGTC